jgi:hypothetical protein
VTRWLVPAAVVAFVVTLPADADNQCRIVTVSMVPTDQLQIAAWVEQPDGTFVDTVFLTAKVGKYGLGNRPGRFDFNSGPVVHDLWPYGRRVNTFPVWAHRHGRSFPKIVFQDANEDGLSHEFNLSSPERNPFCRPMKDTPTSDGGDMPDWDAGTCASPGTTMTDKGMLSATETSLYPPRSDLTRQCVSGQYCDSPSVDMFASYNPYDAVTQATPVGGALAQFSWLITSSLPDGSYVLFVETGKAFDYNGVFNGTTLPSPNVNYADYGKPYRGQPSIVYRVPFQIANGDTDASTSSYAGFGDVDGATGMLHAPDPAMITEDTPGSGSQRLELMPGTSERVHVHQHTEHDNIAPAQPGAMHAASVTGTTVTLEFTAPGDDGLVGKAAGYEVRYRSADAMTAANFDDARSTQALTPLAPGDPGTLQTVELDGLLPETDYWIGVRAYDDCHNDGDVSIVHITTGARVGGYVDACFVATAAYGSRMAGDVQMLRHFRDTMLRGSVLGELAVETYYTFGPPVAGVVGESDLLRALARGVLSPIVERVRRFAG